MRRAFTVLAATVVTVGGLAGPAAAQVGDDYIPDGSVLVEGVCTDNAPALTYDVGVLPNDATMIDITWTSTSGGNVVLTDQPTAGQLTWPAGVTTDATIVFGTTPETSVRAVYPCARQTAVLAGSETGNASGVLSAADRSRNTGGLSGVLAATGVEASSLAIGAGALLVAGTSLVLVRRRREGVTD